MSPSGPWRRVGRFSVLGAGCLLAAAALAFRLPAITWGLPLKYAHIDESVVVFYSLRVAAGIWDSGFHDYPALFLNLTAGLFRVAAGLGGGFGGPGFSELAARYVAGNAVFFTLCARSLSVGFGLSTVLWTWRAGRQWGSGRLGFFAALLLALNGLHVRHSHFGTTDVAAAFFAFWAMESIVRYRSSRTPRAGAASGFVAGLAAATKYYPGVLAGPLLLIPWTDRFPRPARTTAWLILSLLGGFLLGSPHTAFAAHDFFSRFAHLAPKIVGVPGGSVPLLPALKHLTWNAGGVFLLGMVGLAASLRRPGPWKTLGILWLVLFAFLGLWRTQSAHYALALYPGLCLFAAWSVDALGRSRPRLAGWVLSGLLAISAAQAYAEVRDLGARDPRLTMGDWIRENLTPGSSVLRFAHTTEFPPGGPHRVRVDFTNAHLTGGPEQTPDWDVLDSFDHIVYASYSPKADPALEALEKRYRLIHREGDGTRFPNRPQVSLFSAREDRT